MTRDQVNAALFLAGLGFGIYKWAVTTALDEQQRWLKAWSPTRYHS
jgi:hypothetical protein